jgi:hypothetical protein
MFEGEAATDVRAHNLETAIGSAAICKAQIMQEHCHRDEFRIGSKRALLRQLGTI